MRHDNIDTAAFNPDLFPESDTDDCGCPADWPDSDSLHPAEQAHLLARLEDELIGIGLIGGRRERAAGTPEAAAVWAIVPEGCRAEGAVWARIWRGVRTAYAEGRR
ncbi:hypothetical protein [Azospirillum sp. B510]|uniref:hypothetical protein n=1 Tax=Azospirillum sp. (strain B510) TaxID=137722 RepID=UPI0005A68C59|nr:hypothetical protein [Azospirillum sp. B510]